MNLFQSEIGSASASIIPSAPAPNTGLLASFVKKNALLHFLTALIGGCLWTSVVSAAPAVNVFLPDTALQADFIANATAHYQGTLVKGLFADTYSFTVTAKKPPVVVLPPPPPPPQVVTVTGVELLNALVSLSSSTYPYGFANGMDEERRQDMELIQAMQATDFAQKTCGGQTYALPISSSTALSICWQAYNVINSSIGVRSGYVFDATGKIISK